MKNVSSVIAWLAASMLVSEFLGYVLHRLLHSGRIGFVSRSHMKHHLLLYGPLQPQRPGPGYKDATEDSLSLGNVGLEWLVPAALLLAGLLALMRLFQVSPLHQVAFLTGCLSWSFLMFSYLHDRMHIASFWMERNRWLRRWFIGARNAHDVHHCTLNDEGFMDKNFGIAFFFFDRLFGTIAKGRPAFNQRGYRSALFRFGNLLREKKHIAEDEGSPCEQH